MHASLPLAGRFFVATSTCSLTQTMRFVTEGVRGRPESLRNNTAFIQYLRGKLMTRCGALASIDFHSFVYKLFIIKA